MPRSRHAPRRLRRWLVDYITAVIEVPADPFPVAARFDSYGLDSIELVIMSGMMEERFALRIEGAELFASPSVAALSRHIAGRLAEG